MADVLVGSERRVPISSGGYGLPPPPALAESLLCRLDQIDLRLRQLEEQRRPAAHADDCDVVRRALHQHTKSLPSALQHVQIRGTLMDRLNLLESRIRQLSCELDLDTAATAALRLAGTSSSSVVVEDRAWSESAPCRDPAPMIRTPGKTSAAAADGSWSAAEMLQKGARQLHRNKPNPSNNNNVKSLKEAKCACHKEKNKKAERNKTNRRWFGVGC